MDVINVVNELTSNAAVLEAEVHEIQQDLHLLQQLTRKYGALWEAPIRHLQAAKVDKCTNVKEIRRHLQLFERHVGPARALCDRLAASKPIRIRPAHELLRDGDHSRCSDLLISVVSPILANAHRLPEPPSRSVVLVQSPKKDCILVQCASPAAAAAAPPLRVTPAGGPGPVATSSAIRPAPQGAKPPRVAPAAPPTHRTPRAAPG
eukprot:EG_transcript_24979